ncbi:MAG: hypothetical protein DI555_06460 [Novosphingobium pentaromativorans]|uniref:Transcription regulator PadR N-terminal domain-containing protein n=1 Tax=Novosphingobium pentaromativorans TaxID=205844 RepID=A0A2W5NRS1_9SPHN|nr:MAG: hypothetical protein DI555_06460 [Novosphingobium pentaromativorans]
MIGKLEELTLLALIRSGADALASDVFARVIQGQSSAAFGAVYTTLTRLVTKGLVEETSVADDQGRKRRAFTISTGGRSALSEAISASAVVGGWETPAWA